MIKFLFVLFTLVNIISCGRDIEKDKIKNLEYFDKALNPIILNYYKDFNEAPEFFDRAIEYSYEKYKVGRNHRGDYSGSGLGYEKIDSNIYLFHASRESDTTADDLVAIYKIEDGRAIRLLKLTNSKLRVFLISIGLSYKEFKE
jgi:hypothetical protein